MATETHIAGVYGDVPDPITGGTQRQGSVALPDWTRLDLIIDGRRFRARDARRYRQELDLRRGVLTTTATWRGARIRYDVLLDRANKRVGLVRLRVTSSRSVSVRSGARERVVRTKGTRTTVAMVARLHTARSGRTYEFSKVVGFATSLDARRPLATARAAARRSPGTIVSESAAAWARLWRSDIVVPGRLRAAAPHPRRDVLPAGQRAGGRRLRASAPSGCPPAATTTTSSGTPRRGCTRRCSPSIPRRRAPSSTTATTRGRAPLATRAAPATAGLRFAWESALTGDEVTPAWAETGHLEQHITADVALAQWQHYLATGDREWLRERGWPVIRGAADFWASRAQPGPDGRLHITQTEGPDEQNWPVDDSAYVNGTAVSDAADRGAGRGARRPAAAAALGGGGREPRRARAAPARRPARRAAGVRRLRRSAGQAGRRRAAHLPVGVPAAGRGRPLEPRLLHAALRPGRAGDDGLGEQHRRGATRRRLLGVDVHAAQPRSVRDARRTSSSPRPAAARACSRS